MRRWLGMDRTREVKVVVELASTRTRGHPSTRASGFDRLMTDLRTTWEKVECLINDKKELSAETVVRLEDRLGGRGRRGVVRRRDRSSRDDLGHAGKEREKAMEERFRKCG